MAEHHSSEKALFGFWIYLMTDLIMFAVLFAAYAVLHNNTFGGISIHRIFNPLFVLSETIVLLVSSFTCGIATVYAGQKDKKKTILLLASTLLLGLVFLSMELSEFSHLIQEGHTPQKSAFLSSFFTLIGAHGMHIFAGSIWLGILIFYLYKRGVTDSNLGKVKQLSLFWHFLDIVWIFIFTIVYLMGAIS
ncbi:MAG: cytochrome o ubiquinol oxidase subunit III [Candidatus Levyibacteriota bacterium]